MSVFQVHLGLNPDTVQRRKSAEGAAKVGEVERRRNVRSDTKGFLNLPVRMILANESILRVSTTKILLQHYLPLPEVGAPIRSPR